MGSVAKSYMRKGFLIYEDMCKYLAMYEEVVSNVWLCNRYPSEFPYIWGKFSFLFYQCPVHHSIADEGYTTVAVSEQDFSARKLKYSALFNSVFEAWAYKKKYVADLNITKFYTKFWNGLSIFDFHHIMYSVLMQLQVTEACSWVSLLKP